MYSTFNKIIKTRKTCRINMVEHCMFHRDFVVRAPYIPF